jgi:hypothetical protein
MNAYHVLIRAATASPQIPDRAGRRRIPEMFEHDMILAEDRTSDHQRVRTRKLLVLSDFDSRVKWGTSLAAYLQDFCSITIMYRDVPRPLERRYFSDGFTTKKYSSVSEAVNCPDIFEYDYVVLALGGNQNLKVLRSIAERGMHSSGRRPVILAGFNGLVEPGDSHGFLCRQGADILCVNSEHDMASFQKLSHALSLDPTPLLLTGYLRKNECAESPVGVPSIKNVLFVEQVGRPANLSQKIYLARQLAAYAWAHPERTVQIKLRNTGWIKHTNSNKKLYSFRMVWRAMVLRKPPNVVFPAASTEELLPDADLCIALNSTVLFEALSMGKKVAVVSDFGVGTHMGNTSFIGSGLFRTIQELRDDKVPTVEDGWLLQNAVVAPNLGDKLRARLSELDRIRERGELAPIKTFYDKNSYPYFYRVRTARALANALRRVFFG